MSEGFVLDGRLAADTMLIGDLPLCRALLFNDSRYPWIILVPRHPELTELHQLTGVNRQRLWEESALISAVLESHFKPDKLNVAALGNVVPQLHLHHIARYRGDPAWPGPVWGHSTATAYLDDEAQRLLGTLRHELVDSIRSGHPA